MAVIPCAESENNVGCLSHDGMLEAQGFMGKGGGKAVRARDRDDPRETASSRSHRADARMNGQGQ